MADYLIDWNATTANGSYSLTGTPGSIGYTVTTPTNVAGQTATAYSSGSPSAPALWVSGISEPVVTTINFASPVQGLNFDIYDIDFFAGGWDDKLTIIALDAQGNQVPITWSGLDAYNSASGNTLNADGSFSGGVETIGAPDSAHAYIASPIVSIQFIFDNGESWATSGMFGIGNITLDKAVLDYTVEGGSGNDLIDFNYVSDPEGDKIDHTDGLGGTQNDLVYAYGGNDTIYSGAGNDTIYSGTGNDLADGGDGADVIYGDAGDDRLIGNGGADSLFGGMGNDSLYGGLAGDYMDGGANDDLLYGGDGNDSLFGGTGNDKLYGEAGNDTLDGGTGIDSLYGGDGDDTLYAGGRQ